MSLLSQDPLERRRAVRQLALDAGFDDVGVAAPGPYPEMDLFATWVDRGLHGDMKWMERHQRRRRDPDRTLAGVRSVIAVALDYDTAHPRTAEALAADPEAAWVSRYAWGSDYHQTVAERLQTLCERLSVEAPGHTFRSYVDHGPALEKVFARYAGLGWAGKHTNLIHPERGSFFFLAVVFTDLEIATDQPIADHCGTCTACLDACPTDAFVAPWVLDARRCISYLTIEAKEAPESALSEAAGAHLYGCDICQDVCPWNRKPTPPNRAEFQPRPGLFAPRASDLADASDDRLRELLAGTAAERRGPDAVRRRALEIAGRPLATAETADAAPDGEA